LATAILAPINAIATAGIIGILVYVGMKPGVEILKFFSRKSLDLAVRGDSLASEPNEKVSAPSRWRDTGRQYGPEPSGIVP
jgi:hypothetical protein